MYIYIYIIHRSSNVSIVPTIDVGAFFDQFLHLPKKKKINRRSLKNEKPIQAAKIGLHPPAKSFFFVKRLFANFFFNFSPPAKSFFYIACTCMYI